MYQYQNPAHTSAPTKLLRSEFLNPATEPSVEKENNPLLHNIESWSQETSEARLARTDGRFQVKVQEMLTKGTKTNLAKPKMGTTATQLTHTSCG